MRSAQPLVPGGRGPEGASMRIGDTPDTVDELPARSVRHGRPAGPPTLLAALVLLVGGAVVRIRQRRRLRRTPTFGGRSARRSDSSWRASTARAAPTSRALICTSTHIARECCFARRELLTGHAEAPAADNQPRRAWGICTSTKQHLRRLALRSAPGLGGAGSGRSLSGTARVACQCPVSRLGTHPSGCQMRARGDRGTLIACAAPPHVPAHCSRSVPP